MNLIARARNFLISLLQNGEKNGTGDSVFKEVGEIYKKTIPRIVKTERLIV
jgi:hypothetical protein